CRMNRRKQRERSFNRGWTRMNADRETKYIEAGAPIGLSDGHRPSLRGSGRILGSRGARPSDEGLGKQGKTSLNKVKQGGIFYFMPKTDQPTTHAPGYLPTHSPLAFSHTRA